jgi:oligopeptide/dipeptide ABC transporter, ATP-binding protein, C-terminal domain
MELLKVEELATHFFTTEGVVEAVNDVTFTVNKGEIMGLVGESGSGKSITGLSILGLVPQPNGRIVNGKIMFNGENLVTKSKKDYRRIQGNEIAMIFQNPLTAMDPSFKIGNQMVEIIHYRRQMKKKDAQKEAIRLLDLVGIHEPERVIKLYPHSLSGGMRQRVMIAMALSCRPKLLIADEPTTALDATIQKQILNILKNINEKLNTSILMITHDFGVVANLCDKVAVMYAGRIVEYGATNQILRNPLHPYTKGLIGAVPKSIGGDINIKSRLTQIIGQPPDLLNLNGGCSFFDRCKLATDVCKKKYPEISQPEEGHFVRCFNIQGD